MPKVSVIVPVYNVEKYIGRCLESLVNQTLKDIEIIVVNDGSTDNSEEIIKEYKRKFNNIIYAKKENGGLSDARNFGLIYATGEYVAFLDSDDFVDKTIYEKMYAKAKETQSDYVECDFYWSYPVKGTSNSYKNKLDTGIRYKNKKEMMTYARVVAWNKLIKKDIIKNNFPVGMHYEDIEFFYKLIPNINKFAFVEEPLIYYIQREDSLINKQDAKTKQIFTVLENVIKFYKQNGLYEEYKKELEYTYARILLCSSLKRMAKIEDATIRELAIEETWNNLNNKFPKWKQNGILNNSKEKRFANKNLYMKTINKNTFKLYAKIFKII